MVTLSEQNARDPAEWCSTASRAGVTIWNSVPAAMELLIDYLDGRPELDQPPLRVVMLSGDWIPLALPGRVRSRWQDAELVSLGGATEGAIWSIEYPIDNVSEDWESIPYGKPLTNQKVLVLDNRLCPSPDWVEGNIYIGGSGVAAGYYGAAELTAQSFIRHQETNERLYRTGDLGLFRSDGNIQFLGRRDSQVKINGYRIELGEVERKLTGHPRVELALATIDKRATERAAVHAFVRMRDDARCDESELLGFLARILPPYMIPARIHPLASVPLTANGKVDRAALVVPEERWSFDRNSIQCAPTDMEKRVLSLVCETAGRAGLSADQNFFDLGLASRELVRLRGLLEAEVKSGIPLTWLFQYPTVNKLARQLTALQEGEPTQTATDPSAAKRAALRRGAAAKARTRRLREVSRE
jgi:acyl-coenzyme A synthetase/AMP-(fatty) acid ligase/acyl carrier protein